MTTIIPGLSGLDSASAFRALQKDPNKYITSFTKANKQLQTDTDYFNKVVAKYTTTDQLFKDSRAMKYIMESYGLGTETNSLGLIKKVLSEDPTATGSVSGQLADTKYATMAKALRLDKGLSTLQGLATAGRIKTSYIQNEFEETLGAQDTALRQAAYFARNTSSISDVYSVLGDKVLRAVTTATLSLPDALAIQPIESQAAAVAKKVDVTKFKGTGTATVSAAQLTRATSDHTLIETNLTASDAAIKQVKSIQDTINQLATSYSMLSTVTDPNGDNASTIAIQQTAIPKLVGNDQLLQAGSTAISSVSSILTSLQSLIKQAGTSGSNLSSLKSQFSDLVNQITDKVTGADVTMPDGSTQNLLLNGSDDTQTTIYDDQNSSVSMNRYDITQYQGMIQNAATAFNNISDSSDTANINTALSGVLRSMDAIKGISKQITTDQTSLATATSTGFFAASLNSTDLIKGQQSVNDALDRNTQIATLLGSISTLATKAAALSDSDDHTAVEAQFADYKTQLHSLIDNPGTTGLDNLLNSSATKTYEIVNGQTISVSGGADFATQIGNVIDAASISNQAGANALYVSSIQATNNTDRVTRTLTPSVAIFDDTISNLDPRGKLDNQVYALQSNLAATITAGASGSVNLLSATQKNVSLSNLSTGTSLTFRSVPTLASDLATELSHVVSQLSTNDTSAIANALDDAAYTTSTAYRTLTSDNRVATIEYGRLGSTIDALTPKNTDATSKLYQTNAFTQKFLNRYLTLNGSNGQSTTTNYLTALFSSSDSDSSSAISSILSLANSIKA